MKYQKFLGEHFWVSGYCVSTVNRDEEKIRTYIRNQEDEEHRLNSKNCGFSYSSFVAVCGS